MTLNHAEQRSSTANGPRFSCGVLSSAGDRPWITGSVRVWGPLRSMIVEYVGSASWPGRTETGSSWISVSSGQCCTLLEQL